MTRYLLDTNMMGHFINHRRGVDIKVRQLRSRGIVIGTCEPVVAELYFGIENSATRKENLERLERALSRIRCWPFDRRASRRYGQVATELKRAGQLIQQVDMQIAAVALSLGNCTVVSADSDMAAVPGLAVENWATPASS